MKKIVLSLALLGLLSGLVVMPAMVSAQGAPDECTIKVDPSQMLNLGGTGCPSKGDTCNYADDFGTAPDQVSGATCCIFSTILYAVRWITMFLTVVVVLLIVMGAFSLVTSGGDAEKVKKGRDYIVYGLAGLAVSLLAFALPYIIREIMGF